MTVTCHFIDGSWQLENCVLETSHLRVAHTAENIAAELKRIAQEWNISEKVVALVTDNAANAVAAARLTGWKHIPCFAHTLNLIVKGALEADPGMVALKKNCKASDKLREIQRQLGLTDKKLIQDVDTRWNSTFYMFERIVEQHDPVTTTLCLQSKGEMCLSNEDIELIKKVLDLLRPFEVATVEMSAEKFVSVSKIIPIARSLQLVTVGSSTTATTLPLKQELVAQIQHRFANIEANQTLAKSTLLDPRLKKLAFRNNGQRQGLQSLVNELTSLPNNVQEESVVTVAPTTANSDSDVLWKEFDSKVADSVNHLNTRDRSADAMPETGLYFGEKLIPRDSEPLKWWHEHGKNYPKMSKLARKYLCATATSVPSEHLF
ncbi:zinc finger BED domain-containing 1-like [Paramuricea clavata]|uniref:Zinc finger BED domain-containing 1-like n=1 Tax=Paramuricea clavata TaxID=317549 RepID=A0A7D9LBD9_PARCT|nr:zinc finger BED domain-containing 1-like [Paramuricea clavata]